MSTTAPAPSAYTVQRVVGLAMQTLDALRTEHGQIIEGDDDIVHVLASEGVDVDTIIRRLGRAALDAKANAATADARMDDLKARRDRFRNHEEAWRNTLLAVMEALGLTSFRDAEFSLSITQGRPKVIVTDETQLSDDLVTVVTTRTPNKAAILAALLSDQITDGAILRNASSVLTIRSK